jgi:hypothetical protein
MTKRETYITYASYFVFIFALTCFGPYHGWIYGLVFSIGELDARTIHVEGCVGTILCGGENMTRIM